MPSRRLSQEERLYRGLKEASVQLTLTDLAAALGGLSHHETDSRRTHRGWPDLAMPIPSPPGRPPGHGTLWVIECKKELEQLEPPQLVWAEAVQGCNRVEYRLARPSNLTAIVAEIVAASGRGI